MQMIAAGALALGVFAAGAQAQVLTLSTSNPGGLGHSVGSAIAKVVNDTTDLRMIVVPSGGAVMPAVAGGEAECGIATAYDLAYYVGGGAYYEAEGSHPALRAVAAVLPSLVAIYVKADSDIESLSDLRGKRVPGELNAQPAIDFYYKTFLDIAGLTRDDVETIAAPSITQAADDFSAGRNDVFVFSVGTAKVLEIDSSVGGLRALPVEATDETRAILERNLPGARFTLLQPGQGAAQIVEPTNTLSVDLMVFCTEAVPDDAVAKITRSIHDNPQALAESFAAMKRFVPADMAAELQGVTYHPGAVAYYRDAGLWPPEG